MLTAEFLARLRAYAAPNVFNPWSQRCPERESAQGEQALSRVVRLQRHFDCVPKFLLVGEAPGYLGCRYSGVPFTSERLLAGGAIPRIGPPEFSAPICTPLAEPSATIVWGILHELGIHETTVMWNAFPWHPHKHGKPMSNRTPTPLELEHGRWFLEQLRELLCYRHGTKMIAVGAKAAASMVLMGMEEFPMVRHPANGGATKFRDGMRKLIQIFGGAK